MLYNIVMNKIEVQNLNKKFGDMEALSNFSYAFEEGKKYFIVGPTGSGKTTLLNIIAGIESGDEKSIVKINGVKKFFARPGLLKNNVCVKITDIYDEMYDLMRDYE